MLKHEIAIRKFSLALAALLCMVGLAACGNRASQLRELQQQVWQNPEDPAAYLNLGKGYARQQQYTKAIEAYRKALALEPDLDEAHAALGAAYFNQKNYSAALTYLKKRVDLSPDDSLRHFDLGNVYLHLGRYDSAIASYRQAIENSYSFDEAYYNMAVCYIREGNTAEAERIHAWLQKKNNYLAVSLERHMHEARQGSRK